MIDLPFYAKVKNQGLSLQDIGKKPVLLEGQRETKDLRVPYTDH